MTKGQLEADISAAMITFEKEYMGRGPEDVRTHIIQDLVVIRLKGVLTPAERHLAEDEEGVHLIKQVRAKLLENAQHLLTRIIKEKTGCEPVSLHTDISTKTGERFIIVTLDRRLEERFQ